MLKPYDKPEDIPAELKEHYSRREDGKYHADIPNEHPAVKHNATLLGEKTAAIAERDQAKSDLASAQASGLPRGHVAVPKADAELLTAVKAEGLDTAEKVKALKTEHGEFKQKADAADTAKHATDVAEAMGWDKEKTARTATKVFDFSTLEVKDKDGKKTVVAKVKTGENQFTEKPFAEVVQSTPELSDLLPSLASTQGGVQYVNQSAGGQTPKSEEDLVTKRNKEREKARQQAPNPLMPKPTTGAASA